MTRPAHRPPRSYAEAPIHWTRVELDECPFCGAPLITTSSREVDKYVQTLNGPVHVIGYSRKCSSDACPQPQARYHATQAAKLSLPHVTYGWDVLAYIARRRNEEQRQFKEIWQALETEFEIEISEREVGRLYRQVQALLLGNQAAIQQELAATVESYGQLIMEVDGLQPDGGGPKLYVLHEVLRPTLLSVAMFDQATAEQLQVWLEPYREWGWAVKATLSDHEKALVTALKETWPGAPHQLCQMHFVKDLSEPVHEADRQLQQTIREAMGPLPPVPTPARETEAEEAKPAAPPTAESPTEAGAESARSAQPSPALMQALDLISGVEQEAWDSLSPEDWAAWLSGKRRPASQPQAGLTGEATAESVALSPGPSVGESAAPRYLTAAETVRWVEQRLLAQVPASARPLVEATPDAAAVTYWEHTWYRRAIQDTRHLGSRKPFRCGGLRGYDQLQAIAKHLAVRQEEQGLDPYLTKLRDRVQQAIEQARPLAEEVRQAREWVIRVERLLGEAPSAEENQPPSAIQRRRMRDLLAECQAQTEVTPTLQSLQHTWTGMLDRWEADLYHCHDVEGLPRSNLGVEALFGRARRQQRRLRGQADTSPLAVTGQGYLRADAVGQMAWSEMFCQVPTWAYRFARRCMEAVEAGVQWTERLHRNTTKTLQHFQLQAESLRQRTAVATTPP